MWSLPGRVEGPSVGPIARWTWIVGTAIVVTAPFVAFTGPGFRNSEVDFVATTWPSDLQKPVRRAGVRDSHWTWPNSADFANAERDAAALRTRRWLVAETLRTDGGPPTRFVAIAGRSDVEGWEIVAVRPAETSVASDREVELRPGARGELRAARQGAPETFVFGVGARATVIALHPPAPVSEEARRLTSYASALLEDSPGDPELPTGQCSRDAGPLRAAGRFADQAAAEGALGRFLRLRLRIASNDVPRWASSTAGTAALRTSAASLADAPIRVDAFLAAVCFDHLGASAPRMSVFRLGRTIAESGVSERLTTWLRERVEDPRLDDYERLRMLAILAGVLGREGDAEPPRGSDWRRPLADVARELRALDIPEIARWWVEGVAKE